MKRILASALIIASGFGVTSLAACGPDQPGTQVSVSAAPSGAPYVQRLARDGYKTEKAGTLARVSPQAQKLSKYFEGAAIGTRQGDGTAELVLQVRPSSARLVRIVVNVVKDRASSHGVTVIQDGNLLILRGKGPAAISKALG